MQAASLSLFIVITVILLVRCNACCVVIGVDKRVPGCLAALQSSRQNIGIRLSCTKFANLVSLLLVE